MVTPYKYRHGLFRQPGATDWVSFLVAGAFSLFALTLMLQSINIRSVFEGCAPTDKLRLCVMTVTVREPLVALFPFIVLGIAVLLWRRPMSSVFILFFGAVMIEGLRTKFPDATTDRIPLWRNLSSSGIAPVPFSPGELLIVVGIVVWFLRDLFSQTLHIRGSVLLRHYGLFLLTVIFGFLNGAVSGGDARIALWEVRSQFYCAMMFFLALNLLRSRRDIDILGWIIVVGSGLKGIQGSWRYLVTFGRRFDGNAILEHDKALFLPAYYIFLLLLVIFGGSRRQKRIAFLLLPFVMLADFANKRRASTGGLLIGLVVLTVVLYSVLRQSRLRIFQGALAATVLMSLYASVFWNSHSRVAQPLQAIKSQITPNSRDESSDRYRELENLDLIFQIVQRPLQGRGYGIELPLLPGMHDARNQAPFILYMPHNSILWVWWRTGMIGFTFFWMAVGAVIVRNCVLARTVADPYLRRWAIFAVCVTVMWVMLGWWDQSLLIYREVVYVWIILAVPEVLRRLPHGLAPTQGNIGAGAWER